MKRLRPSRYAIIGGGPVGLLLSNKLSSLNIPHTLFERESSISSGFKRHPRAHVLNARSLEILRELGPDFNSKLYSHVSDVSLWSDFRYTPHILSTRPEEYARAEHIPCDVTHSSPSMSLASRASNLSLHTPIPYPSIANISQPKLEKVLYEEAIKSPYLEMKFGTEVLNITEQEGSVSMRVQSPTSEKSIHEYDYVIACDGPRSKIREDLGIKMNAKDLEHFCSLHFTSSHVADSLTKNNTHDDYI